VARGPAGAVEAEKELNAAATELVEATAGMPWGGRQGVSIRDRQVGDIAKEL